MRVLISGAGIAGLSLALRLGQRGLTPILVERSPALRAAGYMLGLVDPGFDAAERLGIVGDLRRMQYAPQQIVYVGPDGKERWRLKGGALATLVGDRQLSLMRGDIERVLYDNIRDGAAIRFGTSVEAIDASAAGITATLTDGTKLDADLVVGADGLHSRIRSLCFGEEKDFIRFLGARVAAFVLDHAGFPDIGPGETHSMTQVGRGAAIASVRDDQLVAFFIFRTRQERRFGSVEEELRHAFSGAGWHVGRLLDRMPQASSVYFDDVAQVVCPRWASGRAVLLGDAGSAVSLIAGGAASLAIAGGLVLADALADMPDDLEHALGQYEARMRPFVERAQKSAQRAAALFMPDNRFHLALRDIGLRLASSPLLAKVLRPLFSRDEDRL
jgi:2-polyprenyl-6-methoxyphenol hydroxylase-like FAD-dependent oxidoreductase